jgi:hypothetical protein
LAVRLIVTVSFLASFFLGGHRYFFCAQMNEASFDACCQRTAESADDEGPSADLGDVCCKSQRFLPTAPGVTPADESALRVPLAAVLPAVVVASAPPAMAIRAQDRRARDGPSSSARAHRQRIMVSLT